MFENFWKVQTNPRLRHLQILKGWLTRAAIQRIEFVNGPTERIFLIWKLQMNSHIEIDPNSILIWKLQMNSRIEIDPNSILISKLQVNSHIEIEFNSLLMLSIQIPRVYS